tara:strand:- start:179 stop:430 length:252 start_codon:yes stop_codon:yes gene_type:complete
MSPEDIVCRLPSDIVHYRVNPLPNNMPLTSDFEYASRCSLTYQQVPIGKSLRPRYMSTEELNLRRCTVLPNNFIGGRIDFYDS